MVSFCLVSEGFLGVDVLTESCVSYLSFRPSLQWECLIEHVCGTGSTVYPLGCDTPGSDVIARLGTRLG